MLAWKDCKDQNSGMSELRPTTPELGTFKAEAVFTEEQLSKLQADIAEKILSVQKARELVGIARQLQEIWHWTNQEEELQAVIDSFETELRGFVDDDIIDFRDAHIEEELGVTSSHPAVGVENKGVFLDGINMETRQVVLSVCTDEPLWPYAKTFSFIVDPLKREQEVTVYLAYEASKDYAQDIAFAALSGKSQTAE